jgi:hypothetical protein
LVKNPAIIKISKLITPIGVERCQSFCMFPEIGIFYCTPLKPLEITAYCALVSFLKNALLCGKSIKAGGKK